MDNNIFSSLSRYAFHQEENDLAEPFVHLLKIQLKARVRLQGSIENGAGNCRTLKFTRQGF